MPTLRVGLNLTFLTADSGGSGRYTRELIPAMLEAEADLRLTGFVSADAPADLFSEPWADDVDWVRFRYHPTRSGPVPPLVSMAVQWAALPAIAARRRLHLLHGLANVVPVVAPRARTVVTVHDLIWLRHPQTMHARATLGMKVVTPLSARSSDRVLAVSRAVRDDLISTLGIAPGKIDVVHHGVRRTTGVTPSAESELRRRLDLGDGLVVLCVGQIRRHKNLERLVEAIARVADARVRLVIAGVATDHGSELEETARRLGVLERLRLPGWVGEADLEGLYGLAACFVLPSLEEGFGLPVLEAMLREIPVACSNTTSLPEVAGDAALLFDPRDVDAISAAVERLLHDEGLRKELIARGIERCRRFTWEETGRTTLASYRSALEN
ncbi:MAG: glycosyltransferase family 4 protein [Actinomycetota bacterium]|nr:glycosyltransferase family 4 protein [Actinomycetota bacterium]